MLVALAALWGASFLFIAIALDDLGAFGVAEGRIVLGVAGLAAYAAAVGRIPSLRARWRGWLMLGAVNAAIPFALIGTAQETLPASLAAIVNATAPLFSAIGAALWLGEPLGRRAALGLGLGVAGVALVVGGAPLELDAVALLSVGASLGAAAAYAVGGHLVRLRFSDESPLALGIGQHVAAFFVLLPGLALVPPHHVPDAGAVWAIVALGLACTSMAYVLYFRLIAELGATSALTVTYLVPVFGVLWAALFRDEHITGGMVLGAAVVLAGVILVTRRSPPPPPEGPRAVPRDPLPGPSPAPR